VSYKNIRSALASGLTSPAVAGEIGDGAVVGGLALFRKEAGGNLALTPVISHAFAAKPFLCAVTPVISHAFAAKPFLCAGIGAVTVLQIFFFIWAIRCHALSPNVEQASRLLSASGRSA